MIAYMPSAKIKLCIWRYRGGFFTKLLLFLEEAFKHRVKCKAGEMAQPLKARLTTKNITVKCDALFPVLY